MKIIAGIEGNRGAVIAKAKAMTAPVMLSANSYWNDQRGRFSPSWRKCAGLEIHLDSGGFVAMARYGRYRFSVEQYTQLAAEMRPVWWAQMDLCCEPEIAANRAEVFRRIDQTAANLRACRAEATRVGTSAPLIVLQGWNPSDYVSGPAFDDSAFEWPEIVGVGSVCRRQMGGPDGLLAVIGKIDAKLPLHVRLHLFGVKSKGAEVLRNHPRIYSVDSMAHSRAAREHAKMEHVPCTNEMRAEFMVRWLAKQRVRISNAGDTPDLFKTHGKPR